jgi:hypothetical protein
LVRLNLTLLFLIGQGQYQVLIPDTHEKWILWFDAADRMDLMMKVELPQLLNIAFNISNRDDLEDIFKTLLEKLSSHHDPIVLQVINQSHGIFN